jgi:glycosyltransferase involved in cell wall biosynthesis
MPRLTVIIPCKNERPNIHACIASVREIADEIILADSGSTDGSIEIARRLGCRIIQREYVNSADFKNWAIPQATHKWVLIVDADERISPPLAQEIRATLGAEPQVDAFELCRVTYFMGHPIRHCGWDRDYLTRLFRRDVGRYEVRRVHSRLEVSTGRVGRLQHTMEHRYVGSLSQKIAKDNRYSSWAAQDLFDKGRRARRSELLLRAPLRFLQLYLLKGGFLDGTAGLIVCVSMAYYSWLKAAKLWGMQHAQGESSADAPKEGDDWLTGEQLDRAA